MKLLNLDTIKLFFRNPNWRIGNTIRFWRKTYYIKDIYKNYEYSTIHYKLDSDNIEPSEGLLEFYNKCSDRRRY